MSVNKDNFQRSEFYKQALESLRKSKKPLECPLNSPNIGLISENDHRIRACLCPLCTCGKHICPSKTIQDPYPSSIYNSQYMATFVSRSPQKTLIPNHRSNFLPSVPFDFETTNEEYYKPHNISFSKADFTKEKNPNFSSPPKTPFNAKSSYSSNFINWGNGVSQIVKPKHEKHTIDEIKLRTNTSYNDNFSVIDKEEAKAAKPATVRKSNNTKIDPKAIFCEDTTNKRDFLDFSKSNIKEKGYKQQTTIPRMKSVENHYVSTTKNDFRPITKDADHRVFRKFIEKEGLVL